MDVDPIERQDGAENLARDSALSAQQLYQHDPLLVLLKDKLQLSELWICVGVIAPPGCVFLFWWLGWASKVPLWVPDDTLSVLLQIFVLFPLLFLIYVLVPDSTASLFNTLKANDMIG